MKRTKEERRAWYEGMRELAGNIRAMTDEEREAFAARVGTITAEGHRLSVFNCCFLAMECGRELAQVGGYAQWQRVGRQVRKDEHHIGHIWAPSKRKKTEADNGAGLNFDNGNGQEGRKRFVLVPVFDITQTEELEG